MTLCTCPHCGFDFKQLDTVTVGNLVILSNGAQVMWKGRLVKMTNADRLMVLALVRANGHPVSKGVLAEAIGSESDNPENIISVRVVRINHAFRKVDPDFDMMGNVWGVGHYWKALAPALA